MDDGLERIVDCLVPLLPAVAASSVTLISSKTETDQTNSWFFGGKFYGLYCSQRTTELFLLFFHSSMFSVRLP